MNLWDTGFDTEQAAVTLFPGERRIPVNEDKLPKEPGARGNNGRHSSGAYQTCQPRENLAQYGWKLNIVENTGRETAVFLSRPRNAGSYK